MLNLKLLYTLLDLRAIRAYLGIVACVGFSVLFDTVLILRLAHLLGPWIAMTLISLFTVLGLIISHHTVEKRCTKLVQSVDGGHFQDRSLPEYLGTLLAVPFLVIPGLMNTVIGAFTLIPTLSNALGSALLKTSGMSWQDAYEYLRLERLAQADTTSDQEIRSE